MAEGNSSSVRTEMSVTATVNAPEQVTLWSRSTGIQVGTYEREEAAALSAANPDLTPIKYDLDGAEEDFLSALAVVEPVTATLVGEYKRLGYVPEGNEAAWNEAMGQLKRAAMTLSLAMGASLPNEGEVKSWSEHRVAHGSIDTETLPNLHRAAKSIEAIDAYEVEKGGHRGKR